MVVRFNEFANSTDCTSLLFTIGSFRLKDAFAELVRKRVAP